MAWLLTAIAVSACDAGTVSSPSPTPSTSGTDTSPSAAAAPDGNARTQSPIAQDCSTSGEHPTRTLVKDLVNAFNAGDPVRVRSLFAEHIEDLWDPTSIPQTGTARPTVETWVQETHKVDEQLTLDQACVYRAGGATGVLSRTSDAFAEAGLNDGVTQNFKVQVVNDKIRRLVLYLPSGWTRLCEHFAEEMEDANAPQC